MNDSTSSCRDRWLLLAGIVAGGSFFFDFEDRAALPCGGSATLPATFWGLADRGFFGSFRWPFGWCGVSEESNTTTSWRCDATGQLTRTPVAAGVLPAGCLSPTMEAPVVSQPSWRKVHAAPRGQPPCFSTLKNLHGLVFILCFVFTVFLLAEIAPAFLAGDTTGDATGEDDVVAALLLECVPAATLPAVLAFLLLAGGPGPSGAVPARAGVPVTTHAVHLRASFFESWLALYPDRGTSCPQPAHWTMYLPAKGRPPS